MIYLQKLVQFSFGVSENLQERLRVLSVLISSKLKNTPPKSKEHCIRSQIHETISKISMLLRFSSVIVQIRFFVLLCGRYESHRVLSSGIWHSECRKKVLRYFLRIIDMHGQKYGMEKNGSSPVNTKIMNVTVMSSNHVP